MRTILVASGTSNTGSLLVQTLSASGKVGRVGRHTGKAWESVGISNASGEVSSLGTGRANLWWTWWAWWWKSAGRIKGLCKKVPLPKPSFHPPMPSASECMRACERACVHRASVRASERAVVRASERACERACVRAMKRWHIKQECYRSVAAVLQKCDSSVTEGAHSARGRSKAKNGSQEPQNRSLVPPLGCTQPHPTPVANLPPKNTPHTFATPFAISTPTHPQPSQANVRALTRNLESEAAKKLAGLPNVTLVKGDFGDVASLKSALSGVDRAYLVAQPGDETQFDNEAAFLQVHVCLCVCGGACVKVGCGPRLPGGPAWR
eukprot:365369-Chlamydomonas_euryale.AAC.1